MVSPAREIIETELIEEFHWLPSDIDKIPYKKLQKLFIIRREKGAAQQTKVNVKNSHSSRSGQRKRYREI